MTAPTTAEVRALDVRPRHETGARLAAMALPLAEDRDAAVAERDRLEKRHLRAVDLDQKYQTELASVCGERDGYRARAEAAEKEVTRAERATEEAIASWRNEIVTVAHVLGGTVEGMPTQTINYLQRIRELRAIEARAEEMRAALVEWERSTTSYEAARGAEVWEAGPRMRAANAALEALARRLAEEKNNG